MATFIEVVSIAYPSLQNETAAHRNAARSMIWLTVTVFLANCTQKVIYPDPVRSRLGASGIATAHRRAAAGQPVVLLLNDR